MRYFLDSLTQYINNQLYDLSIIEVDNELLYKNCYIFKDRCFSNYRPADNKSYIEIEQKINTCVM